MPDINISSDSIGQTDIFSYYPERYAELIAAAKATVGYGRRNTAAIINCPNHSGNNTDNNAAKACAEYGYADESATVSKEDWFLPSMGELYLLHENRNHSGMGNSGRYWSSSQGAYQAWFVEFLTKGGWNTSQKFNDALCYVRPIRAF